METLPILWGFALGPLLDLNQFQAFMSLIKALSSHIEREQTRKLQELSSSNGAASRMAAKQRAWATTSATTDQPSSDADFENLVTGRKSKNGTPDIMNDWTASSNPPNASRAAPPQQASPVANFTWSAAPSTTAVAPQSMGGHMSALRASPAAARTVTPDQSLNSAFSSLMPSTPYSQPMQPTTMASRPAANNTSNAAMSSTPSINWSSASSNNASSWAAQRTVDSGLTNAPMPTPAQRMPSFTIPPPPTSPLATQPSTMYSNFNIAPPMNGAGARTQSGQAAPPKKGLDMYESLL